MNLVLGVVEVMLRFGSCVGQKSIYSAVLWTGKCRLCQGSALDVLRKWVERMQAFIQVIKNGNKLGRYSRTSDPMSAHR
jgi:hypothetical protein